MLNTRICAGGGGGDQVYVVTVNMFSTRKHNVSVLFTCTSSVEGNLTPVCLYMSGM